jgi:catechol 2,3-dioxygenase-like lactoylglutathione lyase family enzyme
MRERPTHVDVKLLIGDIGTVAVIVSDAQKSKKWYVEKLGFELEDDESHWVVVAPPGSSVGLHLCEGEKLEPGNTGITLRADDLEATYQSLKKNGVQFSRELAPSEWDKNMKYAMLKDPDGNEFWLVSKTE